MTENQGVIYSECVNIFFLYERFYLVPYLCPLGVVSNPAI